MIYKFTPSGGRLAGHDYYFPPAQADSRTQQRTSTLQSLASQDGDIDAAGTAPMPLASANFAIQFDYFTAWYTSNPMGFNYYNGTNDDFVARENALLHLVVAFAEGGQGVLIDAYQQMGHTGVTDPTFWYGASAASTAVNYYQANVKLSGDLQVTRDRQITHVTANFSIAGGKWLLMPINIPVAAF